MYNRAIEPELVREPESIHQHKHDKRAHFASTCAYVRALDPPPPERRAPTALLPGRGPAGDKVGRRAAMAERHPWRPSSAARRAPEGLPPRSALRDRARTATQAAAEAAAALRSRQAAAGATMIADFRASLGARAAGRGAPSGTPPGGASAGGGASARRRLAGAAGAYSAYGVRGRRLLARTQPTPAPPRAAGAAGLAATREGGAHWGLRGPRRRPQSAPVRNAAAAGEHKGAEERAARAVPREAGRMSEPQVGAPLQPPPSRRCSCAVPCGRCSLSASVDHLRERSSPLKTFGCFEPLLLRRALRQVLTFGISRPPAREEQPPEHVLAASFGMTPTLRC